jgi:hypothetical protein
VLAIIPKKSTDLFFWDAINGLKGIDTALKQIDFVEWSCNGDYVISI